MFSDRLVHDICNAASAAGIEPAALLAVVEVETSGRPFEADGRTPSLRWEPHKCYEQASRISKELLAKFIAADLARSHWDLAADNAMQRNSTERLALIKRARAIDEETANRSASWGLGQTMGFNAATLGFSSATAMVDYLVDGGVPAQLELLVREIKAWGLIDALNSHSFDFFARRFNGSGKVAEYASDLQNAWQRWKRRLALPQTPPAPEASLTTEEIRTIQRQLRAKGYPEVGLIDGKWGPSTAGAIKAFQRFEGLPDTGHYDAATRDALATAGDRTIDEDRANTTAPDLREQGSRTIAATDKLSWFAHLMKWIFGAGVIGTGAEQGGLLDQAQQVTDKVSQAHQLWNSIHSLVQPLFTPQFLIICAVGFAAGWAVHELAKKIAAYRTEDHQTGVHRGVGG